MQVKQIIYTDLLCVYIYVCIWKYMIMQIRKNEEVRSDLSHKRGARSHTSCI